MNSAGPVMLWGRATLLGIIAVFVGAAGHLLAGGLLPSTALVGLFVVLAVVGSAVVLGIGDGPASLVRLGTLIVGGQAATHTFLSATGGHLGESQSGHAAVTATRVTGGGLSLAEVDGRRVGNLMDAYQTSLAIPTSHHDSTGASLGDLFAATVGHAIQHGPMMAAHTVAAALVALWLWQGERALWAIVALLTTAGLRKLLQALARFTLPVTTPPDQSHPSTAIWVPRLLRLRPTTSRRGPPALLATH